jgi:hypothetical protein
MGVARNPLRDGAPPTGFTFEHHFRVFSREHGALEGESTKPSPCFIVHRVSGARPGPRCATFSIRSRDHFSRRRTGGRLRRSSRRCSPSIKDDLVERSSVTPRAALEQGNSHLLRSRRRGACVAPCEPGRLQSNRGRKWPSPHDVLSRTPLAGSTRFARFMSPKATDRVENPRSRWPRSRSDGTKMGTRERPRSPVGSEASSDAGSSGSRAPVAAFRLGVSRKQLDVDQPGPRHFSRIVGRETDSSARFRRVDARLPRRWAFRRVGSR